MELEELNIYRIAMELGEEVYTIVAKWEYSSKKTIGFQLVRAVDSIAVNIAEGYGRYHFKEVNNFSFYARGSLFETKAWLTKASNRGLITDVKLVEFEATIKDLSVKLNNYIKAIKTKI